MLAEQEERRRVAELLHDGPVQQLSAIAQMLDAGLADLDERRDASARDEVFARGLELARDAARDLRALCDDLEPRALHQLGFAAAVGALARRIAVAPRGRDRPRRRRTPTSSARTPLIALYQILREATEQAVKRGPLTRIEISLRADATGGGVELVVSDDGPPERRAAVLEALAERAATLNGRFSSEVRYPRGSTIRIEVPPAAAHR